MHVCCPFCHDEVVERAEAVRCARCAAPHHRECWDEHGGACSVHACGGREARPFTRRAAARIVLGAGKQATLRVLAEARDRLGAKSVVALLLVSTLSVGLGSGYAARALLPTGVGALEVALLGVFVVLATWITALLYRGDRLHDDLDVSVAARSPGDYYARLWRGITGERGSGEGGGARGCADGCADGCSGGAFDGEGVLVLLVFALVVGLLLLLGPLLVWLAVELLFPIVALAVYTLLYGALALAVHASDAYRGRLLPSLARGVLYAALYTAVIGGILVLAPLFTG